MKNDKQQGYFAALDIEGNICGFGTTPASAIRDARKFSAGRNYKAVQSSEAAYAIGRLKGSQDLTFDLRGRVVPLEENDGLWFHQLEAPGEGNCPIIGTHPDNACTNSQT